MVFYVQTAMSKVKYTDKEVSDINNACDILDIIRSHPSFQELVVEIYGKDVHPKSVQKYLTKINNVRKKINKNVKEETNDTKREIYFERKRDVTEASLYLYDITKRIPDVKSRLRFNQKEYTCQIDIRIMMYAYIRYNNLRDENKGVRIDKHMKELAPSILGNMDHIPKTDKKTLPNAIMEIIG